MIEPITIYGVQDVVPEMIRYDENGIWVKDYFRVADNPRAEFAKLLSRFTDDSTFIEEEGSLMRSNTIVAGYFVWGDYCVIGSDGFGFEREENGTLLRMKHLGNVVIGENVEIGNNVNIDRAVIGSTIIGEGTKIDNLVHVGHGAKIGKNCLIVAGSVIGGSAEIGDNCFIGINASVKNKVKIENNCIVGMGAVVTKNIPDGETWIGNPATKFEKK